MAQFQKSSANNGAPQASHRKVIKAFLWENLKQHKYPGGSWLQRCVCTQKMWDRNGELPRIKLQGGFVLTPSATDIFPLDILYCKVWKWNGIRLFFFFLMSVGSFRWTRYKHCKIMWKAAEWYWELFLRAGNNTSHLPIVGKYEWYMLCPTPSLGAFSASNCTSSNAK